MAAKRKMKTKKQRNTPQNNNSDTLVLKTIGFSNDMTAASSLYSTVIAVDGRTGGTGAGAGGASIMNNYRSYFYQSMVIRFVPKLGPGTSASGGRIFMSYTDNPEVYDSWNALTDANKLVTIKKMYDHKVGPVWKQWIYRVPLTRRRSWFDVNYNITDDVNVDDRSVQGYVFVVAETINATDIVGNLEVKSVIHLKGMDNYSYT